MIPRIVVTIDTETFRVGGKVLPFNTHHYADLPDGSYGVQRIMNLCDEYGAKATFFVDVYMHHQYGEAQVEGLCTRIDRAGHDVQLHVHTSWIPGAHSGLLCDFPLDSQITILSEGRDLIQKWIGKTPRGFRAGAYSANLDTIRALKETGFRLDSSYFPLNRNCELARQIQTPCINNPFYIDGIFELPVTTYWLWNHLSFKKNSKLDVNACSGRELRNAMLEFSKSSLEYVVVFLHSFSFVRWDKNGENLSPNSGPLRRFETLLKLIRNDLGGKFATVAEICAQPARNMEPSADYVPSLSSFNMLPRILSRFSYQ